MMLGLHNPLTALSSAHGALVKYLTGQVKPARAAAQYDRPAPELGVVTQRIPEAPVDAQEPHPRYTSPRLRHISSMALAVSSWATSTMSPA